MIRKALFLLTLLAVTSGVASAGVVRFTARVARSAVKHSAHVVKVVVKTSAKVIY